MNHETTTIKNCSKCGKERPFYKNQYWCKFCKLEQQHRNKKKVNDYHKEYNKSRKRKDPFFKLRTNISRLINHLLKRVGKSKRGDSCLQYLPFTIEELKQHLESQFEPWMNWNNNGLYNINLWNDNDSTTWTWQLDHIIPQSSLPYSSMEDDNFKKCWSLENLRPYSAKQNLIDGSRKTKPV